MNNENQQNLTDKTKTISAMSMVDELLALKKEIVAKIDDVIALIEQNRDRRLEDAILFVAEAGDGESAREGIGFNDSDSRFGHYLARWLQEGERLTLKQAEAALQMMQKYSQSQLEPNGYSLPTAWEEISHLYLYREPTIEIDLVGHFCDYRLEEAILFLAEAQEGMGFNESDSRFGHYLARRLQEGEPLSLKQAEAAVQMMQKYNQSQLEPNYGEPLPEWEQISHRYLRIESNSTPLRAVLRTGQRLVLQTGDYCDTFIAVHCPNENIEDSVHAYSVEVEGLYTHHCLLDATPGLMDALEYHSYEGYATYVDPDIEAAYYLWEQERQSMVSEREPVLPLYALPPDVLLLDAVPLESERVIDYQELLELLRQQEWYEADRTTSGLILEACRTGNSWNADTMRQLPCAELRTIDRLWVAASGGKFGFSVQRKIWLELGIANLDVDNVEDVELDKFRDAVGWLVRGKHISYRKSPFDLRTAPNGHFPRWDEAWDRGNPCRAQWDHGLVTAATAFQKAEICNLYIPTGEQSE